MKATIKKLAENDQVIRNDMQKVADALNAILPHLQTITACVTAIDADMAEREELMQELAGQV